MNVEELFISSLQNLLGEKLILFCIIYTILGLFILTLKYSIFAKNVKKQVWIDQDPFSKAVYGFIVGISSWFGGLLPTFLFYYLWSLIETPNPTEIFIGAPILILSTLYGLFGLSYVNNKNIVEKEKPIKVFIFSFFTIFIIMLLFLFFVVIEKLASAQFFSAFVLGIILVIMIIGLFFKNTLIKGITGSLE